MIDVARRWDVLRAIAPQLPLCSPARSFTSSGERGALVVPLVQSVSGNDPDRVDGIASALGAPLADVWAQLEDEPADLFQRPIDFVPPERRLSFERLAFLMDAPKAPLDLWWGLRLPVVIGARAWIAAQLCGRYGAEDHAWMAHRGERWTLSPASRTT